MDIRIDRDLPVPVKTQITGQVEYAICYGDLPAGSQLPRVHELAQSLQVSPVTVSHAYAELRQRGLVRTRRGLGTFVASDAQRRGPPSGALSAVAEELRRVRVMASALGVKRAHLHQLLEGIFREGSQRCGLDLGYVGVFKATTATYADAVAQQLGQGDRVDAWAMDQLEADPGLRELLRRRDAVLSLPNLTPRVRAVLGLKVHVFDVPVAPSAMTAQRISAIERGTAVGVVAAFPEFLPIIKRGVRMLAPDTSIVGACIDDPDEITALLPRCELLVVASGCVVPHARVNAIEFLHAPDPKYVSEVLAPQLATLRSERIVATQ